MSPEQQAEELIRDLGITIPISPMSVCESISTNEFKVKYKERRLNSPDIFGISVGDTSQATILVNNSIQSDKRKLFTAAHEIGHVILHIQTGKKPESECNSSDLKENNASNKQLEKEANQFAGSLLMPRFLIQDDIQRNNLGWELIKIIANKCNTSLEATARRVIGLSKEHCALLVQNNGTPWTPVKSCSWSWYLPPAPFPEDTLDCGDYSDLSRKMEECDLTDFGIENINSDEYQCFYSSIYHPGHSRIMTLLRLEEKSE